MQKEKIKILELTSDVVFKSFMMDGDNKNYKAKIISGITGLPEKDLRRLYIPVMN